MIRGAITIAILVAAFIGLARTGAVHGEMCLTDVGCVHAARHDAAFQRSPTPPLVKHTLVVTALTPSG